MWPQIVRVDVQHVRLTPAMEIVFFILFFLLLDLTESIPIHKIKENPH